MVTILSYPRSGNHFVRYLVEFLTGRATLGAVGFTRTPGQDTPICLRSGPQFLTHVCIDAPVANKAHFAHTVPKYTDRLVLIVRHPIEALISHNQTTMVAINDGHPLSRSSMATLASGATKFLDNLNYFEKFHGPKEIVFYEDLLGEGYTEALKSLGRVFEFDHDRLVNLVDNFQKYRVDSMKSPIRKPVSVKKNGSSRFYSDKIQAKNPKVFEFCESLVVDILNHKLITEYYG